MLSYTRVRNSLRLFLFCLIVAGGSAVSAQEVTGGIFGNNLTWEVKDNVLTIGGNGEMPDFAGEENEWGGIPMYPTPWESCKGTLKKIVIGDGITVIGKGAFNECDNVTDVSIGKNVQGIRTMAFDDLGSLTELTIPDSVTWIEDQAIWECNELESLSIGKGLRTMTGWTATGCNLKKLTVSEENPYLCVIDNVVFNKEKTELLYGTAFRGKYKIPETVRRIAPYAFWDGNLSEVTIPDNVTEIESYAFGYCLALKKANIPASVKKIEDNAFFRACQYWPASEEYGWGERLFDLTIEEGVEEIGEDAFYYSAIEKLTIPGSVSVIGKDAFESCQHLKEVTIRDGVTTIKDEAFIDCTALEKVFVPASVTQIGKDAFGYNYDEDFNHVPVQKPVIVGTAGTAAQTYAKENGLSFVTVCQQHVWDNITVKREADCENTGLREKTCSVCGITEKEIIPAAGHKWSEWKTVQKATFQLPEKQSRTCVVCLEEETREQGEAKKAELVLSADSLTLRVKQKTNAFQVAKMTQGDSVKSVKSSKPSVVAVSKYTKKGAVTLKAKKKGTAKITVTLKSGIAKTVSVKVQTGTVKTKKITAPKQITVKKGKKKALASLLTVNPVTTQQKITYRSSNKKVAAVSSAGVVTGKKAGKAKITVQSGTKKAVVTVVVK